MVDEAEVSTTLWENSRGTGSGEDRRASTGGLGVLLFGAPVDEVAGVESDAKKIGGNETELRGADADDTNDSAIEGGHDPTLPKLLANEHGGQNGQNAGDVIESNHVEHSQHVGPLSQKRSLMEHSTGTQRCAVLLSKS